MRDGWQGVRPGVLLKNRTVRASDEREEHKRHVRKLHIHTRISQHEFQAARAEEEQRLLQGQLWQQKLEFREAHQRSLTEMKELRKFQSSAFDTMARRKLIEDQNTILELGQRVQELQHEIHLYE